jgi:small subunit ribosomal protein S20
MPNIKSAKKRLLTSEKARQSNVVFRTRVKTYRRKFMEAIAAKDQDVSSAIYKEYCSVLDKAVKKGVIKKNTAIRRKRRASKRVKEIAS